MLKFILYGYKTSLINIDLRNINFMAALDDFASLNSEFVIKIL